MTATNNLFFREITDSDAGKLYQLTQKHDYARAILGTGYAENSNLARAFANDKSDYPFAYLVHSKETREVTGAFIVHTIGADAYDISIITDDIDSFFEVLVQLRKELAGKKVFVTSYDRTTTKILEFFSSTAIAVEDAKNKEFKMEF